MNLIRGKSLQIKIFLTMFIVVLSLSSFLLFIVNINLSAFIAEEINRKLNQHLLLLQNEFENHKKVTLHSLMQPASADLIHHQIINRNSEWLLSAVKRWKGQLDYIDCIMLLDTEGNELAASSDRIGKIETKSLFPLLKNVALNLKPYSGLEIIKFKDTQFKVSPADNIIKTGYQLVAVNIVPVVDSREGMIAEIITVDILANNNEYLDYMHSVIGYDPIVRIRQQWNTISVDKSDKQENIPLYIMNRLERGETFIYESIEKGKKYKSITSPFLNFANELVGSATISIPEDRYYSVLLKTKNNIMLATAAGIMMSLVAAFILSRMITNPLRKLMKGLRDFERNEYFENVSINSSDEISELCNVFNVITDMFESSRKLTSIKADKLAVVNAELEGKIRESAAELTENDNLLSEILSGMVEGVIVIDSNNKIIISNKAARELLKLEDYKNIQDYRELCNKGAFCELADQIEKVRLEGISRDITLTANGLILKGSMVSVNRSDSNNDTIVLTFHDNTAIENQENLRREFISTLSHELKTPLTSIKGSLSFVLAKSKWLTGTEKELLEICGRNTERLIRLITTLLDMSMLESKEIKFNMKQLSPVDLAMYSADELRGIAISSKVAIINSVDNALPLILGDSDRLVQVLTNLIANAVHFSDEGKIVKITASCEDGKILFSVQDMNRTIPEQERGKLFKKFVQIDQGVEGKLGGSGLGLSICKEIVERHGGSIGYREVLAGGNEFNFSIPIYKDDV